MKRTEVVRIAKRGLTLDCNFALTAVYTDNGSFPASLWPAKKTGQREGQGERTLLVAGPNVAIEPYDRIDVRGKRYRVLWVRCFPKHVEALLEKENP